MYFTDDALLPEHQEPLIITVAPFGPQWMMTMEHGLSRIRGG